MYVPIGVCTYNVCVCVRPYNIYIYKNAAVAARLTFFKRFRIIIVCTANVNVAQNRKLLLRTFGDFERHPRLYF